MAFVDTETGAAIWRDWKTGKRVQNDASHTQRRLDYLDEAMIGQSVCLTSSTDYKSDVALLFERYEQAYQGTFVPQGAEGLRAILEETDGRVAKLLKGFVDPTERERFINYTARKREELVDKLNMFQ